MNFANKTDSGFQVRSRQKIDKIMVIQHGRDTKWKTIEHWRMEKVAFYKFFSRDWMNFPCTPKFHSIRFIRHYYLYQIWMKWDHPIDIWFNKANKERGEIRDAFQLINFSIYLQEILWLKWVVIIILFYLILTINSNSRYFMK